MELEDSFEIEAEKILMNLHQLLSPQSTFSKIITSPSLRCIRLAHYLSHHLGLDIQTDDRAMEYNFGAWEGKPWDSLPPSELEPWMSDFINHSPPSGETANEFKDRVINFINSLRNMWDNGIHHNLILVTHAGVVRLINSIILGYPLENIFRFEVSYGRVYKYHLANIQNLDKAF